MLKVKLELSGEHLVDFYMGYTTTREAYDEYMVETKGQEHAFILSSTTIEAKRAFVEAPNARFDAVTYSDNTKYDYDYITEGYSTENSALYPAGLNYTSDPTFYYNGYSTTPLTTTYGSDNISMYKIENPKPNSDMFAMVCGPEF